MLEEPLSAVEAKQIASKILNEGGAIRFTTHARDEMAKDGMDEQDAINVIVRGVVESIDFERGSWRYRFHVPAFRVVVGFRSETHLVVVTAWRNR